MKFITCFTQEEISDQRINMLIEDRNAVRKMWLCVLMMLHRTSWTILDKSSQLYSTESLYVTMPQWALHSVQSVTSPLFNGGNSQQKKNPTTLYNRKKNELLGFLCLPQLMLSLLSSLPASLVPLCLFLSERNDSAPTKISAVLAAAPVLEE